MSRQSSFERMIGNYREAGGAVLIDMRSEADYGEYHIPGALNISFASVMDEVCKLASFQTPVFLYDEDGKQSAEAANLLRQQGYRNAKNMGGIHHYLKRHKTILQIRKALNLTQKQLADRLGLHHQSICNYENGLYPVSKRTACLIRSQLGYEVLQTPRIVPADPKEESSPVDLSRCASVLELRKALKISQEKLGKATGINRSSICSLEAGKYRLSEENAKKIEAVYGILLPHREK